MIEARDSKVPSDKARQPFEGKGETAEVEKMPEFSSLVHRIISYGLSQNYFVERYRLQSCYGTVIGA